MGGSMANDEQINAYMRCPTRIDAKKYNVDLFWVYIVLTN